MNIHWNGHHLHIDQHKYLKKVPECCGMINTKPTRMFLPQDYQPEKNMAPVNLELWMQFQMVIQWGAKTLQYPLLYLMLRAYPDIVYAVT